MESKWPNERRAEVALLLVLVIVTAFTVLFAVDKIAFLSFYQLPVLITAYLFGKREGIMVAILSVLMVTIYAAIDPGVFTPPPGRGPGAALFIWAAFTIIGAYVVGTLYDAKAAATRDLRAAYTGLIDLITELVDAVDAHSDSQSVRISTTATRIGVAMDLPIDEIESLRVAGLVHDVHKVGVSLDVLRKAAVAQGAEPGEKQSSRPVSLAPDSQGGLLRDVIPLVETYREHFDGTGPAGLSGDDIPRGARILGAAHEFERLKTREPYGRGLSTPEALMELEKGSGSLFDPKVIDALILVSESEGLSA